MKTALTLLALLLISPVGFSQATEAQSNADSLRQVWLDETNADTIRLDACQRLIVDFYLQARPDSAFSLALAQYDLALACGSGKYQSYALYTQATILSRKGEYVLALDYHSQSFAIKEALGDARGMAISLNSMAHLHKELGNYEKALEFYYQSLEIRKEIGDKPGQALVLNGIGAIHFDQSNFELAHKFYAEALSIREETGDEKSMASSYYSLGVTHMAEGNYTEAVSYLTRSLTLQENAGNKKGISGVMNRLGIVYKDQGDYARALSFMTSALGISEEIQDARGIAGLLNDIGNIYYKQGDYAQALDYYNRSLVITEKIGLKKGIAAILLNLGNIYGLQGDSAKALEFYTGSLGINQQLEDQRGIASATNKIGDFYKDRGDHAYAAAYYTEALKINEELGYKKGIAISLHNLGSICFLQRNYRAAASIGNRALELADEMSLASEQKNSAHLLYTSYLRMQQVDSAYRHLSKIHSIANQSLKLNYFTLSEYEKELYFTTIEEDFGLYYDFALASADQYPFAADTAYNIALLIKGLTLKSSTAMRSAILNSGDSSLISDYEQWIRLKKKIAKHYADGADIKELEDQVNNLEKDLFQRSASFSDFNTVQNINWQQVRESLKPHECAIEFIHFRSEADTTHPVIYAAMLITAMSEHPEIVRLCTAPDLSAVLGKLHGNNINFVEQVYGTRKEARAALYELIWKPLEKYMNGIKTVYYSPSGLLHKISFSSISTQAGHNAPAVFLCDRYNFRQMGSSGNIVLNRNGKLGELENFLLMGGVNYNSDTSTHETWSYLPGSLQETDHINDFLQKKKFGVNYFHSNNASEEILKEKIRSTSIVHIATHGFFFPDPDIIHEALADHTETNSDLVFRGITNYANWSFINNKNPLMRSGIVLAQANDVWNRNPMTSGEDGVLTAQEVSALDMSETKLVVLSACETGLGDIKGSEGVFGLQRAFKMAGVKYLIMSLWQVPDKETSEFMQLFYKNLVRLKDIPAAFQKTQKVMRDKYDPYYWGAFVLIE